MRKLVNFDRSPPLAWAGLVILVLPALRSSYPRDPQMRKRPCPRSRPADIARHNPDPFIGRVRVDAPLPLRERSGPSSISGISSAPWGWSPGNEGKLVSGRTSRVHHCRPLHVPRHLSAVATRSGSIRMAMISLPGPRGSWSKSTWSGSELVFVGYGIVAPRVRLERLRRASTSPARPS